MFAQPIAGHIGGGLQLQVGQPLASSTLPYWQAMAQTGGHIVAPPLPPRPPLPITPPVPARPPLPITRPPVPDCVPPPVPLAPPIGGSTSRPSLSMQPDSQNVARASVTEWSARDRARIVPPGGGGRR